MQHYVLPRQFDFMNNPLVEPIVMYMFEFKYELNQDDLSYIWQNMAPRDYKKMYFQTEAVTHELFNTELLTEQNIMENPNLRWMIFKVKQKSQALYKDIVVRQISTAGSKLSAKSASGYQVKYNWPYDFISIVELAKIEAEVLYKKPASPTLLSMPGPSPSSMLTTINASLSRKSRSLTSTRMPPISTEAAKVEAKKINIAAKEQITSLRANAAVDEVVSKEATQNKNVATRRVSRTSQLKSLKQTLASTKAASGKKTTKKTTTKKTTKKTTTKKTTKK
jgi:hypothetical protein